MEVLKDDYILTARAKGLSQKRVRDRHAARTALLPVVTSFIFTIITIIDGSVLTESIFSWPGMGQLILEAVLRRYSIGHGNIFFYWYIGINSTFYC